MEMGDGNMGVIFVGRADVVGKMCHIAAVKTGKLRNIVRIGEDVGDFAE